MDKVIDYPDFVWRKNKDSLALEVSIDFLPDEFRGRWLDCVRNFTSQWVKRKVFTKNATLWMWGTISVNLINRHRDYPVPSWSDFIIQFGLGEAFLKELEQELIHKFQNQVGITESICAQRDDGWSPICHVEGGLTWRQSSHIDGWIPVGAEDIQPKRILA